MKTLVKSTILVVLSVVIFLFLSPGDGGCQWVNHRNTRVSPPETPSRPTVETYERSEPPFSRDTDAEAGDEVPYHPSESAGYPSGEDMENGSGYQTPPPPHQGYGSGNYQPDGSEYATGAPAPSGSDDIFGTINNIIGVVDRGMDVYERGRNLNRDRDSGGLEAGSPGSTDPSESVSSSSGSTEPSGSVKWGIVQPRPVPGSVMWGTIRPPSTKK